MIHPLPTPVAVASTSLVNGIAAEIPPIHLHTKAPQTTGNDNPVFLGR